MPAKKSSLKTQNKKIMQWEAPIRPFKKRDKEYFSTIGAILFLLIVILFFIKEWLLIGVIISMAFLSYVLATVPPEKTVYKISTRGIVVGNKTYKWEDLNRFWFSEKWGSNILNLETKLPFPKHLSLVYGKDKDRLKTVVEKYLLYEKPQATFLDKASTWLQEKVPLES